MRNKIIIIHPGIQHLYRLATALKKSGLFKSVHLYTWFILSRNTKLSKLTRLNKRVKDIHPEVVIHNYLLFEVLLLLQLKIQSILNLTKGHTSRYRMQTYFGYFLLPLIYLNRKEIILILTETAGWPISKYASKWNIPIVMDFPSVSHETAASFGIEEPPLGRKIKEKERSFINYAVNCSAFSKTTYEGKTSARHFTVLLGAENMKMIRNKIFHENLNIALIANTEKRKGLDLLIKAFVALTINHKKLYLVGKIDPVWVKNFCDEHVIDHSSIILSGAMPQQDLANYLISEKINLHILPSRFDSFGMVVPETMMLGIPNIVSPFVGAGEMLENGVDGYIMEELSVNSILQCIQDYLTLNLDEKKMMQEAVLKKANQMTWEHYNERVISAFTEILNDLKHS